MNPPDGLEVLQGYACYRPREAASFGQAVAGGAEAVAWCREQGIRRLLIDARALEFPEGVQPMERFDMGRALADAGRSAVKVALVARPELIDPNRFGAVVARNRGLLTMSFDSDEAALAWLLDPKAK